MTLQEFMNLPEIQEAFEANDGNTIWKLVGDYDLYKSFANLLIRQNMLDDFLKRVTFIPEYAFHHSYLKSINIPNSITEIGDNAFWYCQLLESVNIPNSVTKIGTGAFDSCTTLESVIISNSVTEIGPGAFRDCYELKSITIPEIFKPRMKRIFPGVRLSKAQITYI